MLVRIIQQGYTSRSNKTTFRNMTSGKVSVCFCGFHRKNNCFPCILCLDYQRHGCSYYFLIVCSLFWKSDIESCALTAFSAENAFIAVCLAIGCTDWIYFFCANIWLIHILVYNLAVEDKQTR